MFFNSDYRTRIPNLAWPGRGIECLPIAVMIQERLVQVLNVARRLSAIRSSDEQSTIMKMAILRSRSDVIKLQTGLFRMDRYVFA